MNFNSFTTKSQEVIQKAVDITRQNGQQQIEPVHLLKAVISEGESVVKFLFQKTGVSLNAVTAKVDVKIRRLPKVSGGDQYFSRDAEGVLNKAVDLAQKQGDQFVSVETMLLSILVSSTSAATILKDNGMTQADLTAAVGELRKGKNVTDQGAEDTYNALSKYAINLN